jgi:hypothetical protein
MNKREEKVINHIDNNEEKKRRFNDRSLYIYQEEEEREKKKTGEYLREKIPFIFLSVYKCKRRKKSVRSGIHNYLLHTSTKQKKIFCVYMKISFIIKTDTSTCFIDCLMLRRRKKM